MNQKCWSVWEDRGYLVCPDPLVHLPPETPLSSEAIETLESLAASVPALMESRQIGQTIDSLPRFDFNAEAFTHADFRIVERLMMLYSYFASAYIYGEPENPAHRLPEGVAVPLVRLAGMVERPPILSYSGYVLNNWRRLDPAGEIALGNMTLLQNFLGGRDEDWFILVHVDIEAQAAGALQGVKRAVDAAKSSDAETLASALQQVAACVTNMIHTFHRMPEGCDSDVYYYKVRPYIFGFNDVVYEGVAEFGGKPQTFRGQTGAQSSIVPTLVSALGLQHEQSGLTQHLDVMRDYMPKPHREFIQKVKTSDVREAVVAHAGNGALKDAYNDCLLRVLEFRRLHYHYATTYIFEKVKNPIGTGGTVFMDWLKQLGDETEAQLV
ncbi:MAG: hypothetical protein SF029_16300 [bacterium]|nr:hypothetical protein [bacterium]